MQKTTTPITHHNTLPFPAPHGHAPAPGSAAAAGPDAAEPPASAQSGRSNDYAPKVVEMICIPIRRYGLADSAAAETVGMTGLALSRWKHDFPEVKQKLQQARQECRLHYLELIAKMAEGTNALAFRAMTWMLERVFPGEYAKTQRERWAYQTFEEQRDRNEDREVGNEIRAEKEAARAEARQVAAAAAAKQAAASVSDLHNVKNTPGEGEPPPKEPGCPRPEVLPEIASYSGRGRPDSLNAATRPANPTPFSEGALHKVQNSSKPNAGPLLEAIFGASVTDLHNVKNPGEHGAD